MTDETETTADRLREAAARVRAGWTQGIPLDGDGNVCALGAIFRMRAGNTFTPHVHVLAHRDPQGDLAAQELASELVKAGELQARSPSRPYLNTITGWNDAPTTDAEQVAVAMEKTAAAVEERA